MLDPRPRPAGGVLAACGLGVGLHHLRLPHHVTPARQLERVANPLLETSRARHEVIPSRKWPIPRPALVKNAPSSCTPRGTLTAAPGTYTNTSTTANSG